MRTDHEIFIAILELQEQTTIKISLQDMASIISEEKDKTSSIYLPSGTNPFIQCNTHLPYYGSTA